jgi:hypothetical protein
MPKRRKRRDANRRSAQRITRFIVWIRMDTGSSFHLLRNVSNKRQRALLAHQSIFLILNGKMVAEIASGRSCSVAALHPFGRLAPATN